MQSKNLHTNNQISFVKLIEENQLATLTKNLQYSLQRRLEDVAALSQGSLNCTSEQHLIMLEDTIRLARNDWALLEWLKS